MRYLIGLLITIAVIIFVIIKLLTGGGSSVPGPQVTDLTSLAGTDTVVRMTIENPVQAAKTHREIEITVGRDNTEFVLYRGYDQDIVRTKSYRTGQTAYGNFLRALQQSGDYTNGNNDPKYRNERGYCALGDRYVYEIIGGDGKVLQHYWTTSCGQKTFHGDAETVQDLFQKQIPDYFDLTTDVEL